MARRTPPRGSGPGSPSRAFRRTRSAGRPGTPERSVRPGRRGTSRAPAETAARRPRFTSRMAVLVLVAAVLVVSYASSMRAYLQQRSHINQLQAQIASSRTDIAKLEREKRRWDDEAFVEAQARERFGWVLPGETSYQVIDRDGQPLERRAELSDPDSVRDPLPDPWWERVHDSLSRADHPERTPVPADRITPPPNPKKSSGE